MENKKINYWCAIILAFVGGWIGLQHFYANQTVFGILAVLFWWTCIPALVAYIQMLYWLFDGKENFDKKMNK